jgi:hypothetical protein
VLVVARELQIVALVRHADCDVADAGPGVEPCPERPESPVVRRSGEPGEAECCSQESGALIEHALLLDDLVGPQQQRVRDASAARGEADSMAQCSWLYAERSG